MQLFSKFAYIDRFSSRRNTQNPKLEPPQYSVSRPLFVEGSGAAHPLIPRLDVMYAVLRCLRALFKFVGRPAALRRRP